MFNLFEVFADRVRKQADEYAEAQARIRSRTLASLMNPSGTTSAVAGIAPVPPAPAAGTDLRPPRLKNERRSRRNAHPAAKRSSRQGPPLAANFA